MSKETKDNLDAALEAHITDETEGGILTAWILHSSYLTAKMMDEESTGYYSEYGEAQPLHVSLGLSMMQTQHLTTGFTRVDDDDD